MQKSFTILEQSWIGYPPIFERIQAGKGGGGGGGGGNRGGRGVGITYQVGIAIPDLI